MKCRRQVRRITLPHPPRRSKAGGSTPSICIECGKPIDREAAVLAIETHVEYVHDCGRVLVHARTLRPSDYGIDHVAEAEETAEIEGYGAR